MKTKENLKVKEMVVDGGGLFVYDESISQDEFVLSMCYDTESVLTSSDLTLIENTLEKEGLFSPLKELLLECRRQLLLFDIVKVKKKETYL